MPDTMAEFRTASGPRDAFTLVREAWDAVEPGHSSGELRRLFDQGGVAYIRADTGSRQAIPGLEQVFVRDGDVLKIGKRTFVRLIAAP